MFFLIFTYRQHQQCNFSSPVYNTHKTESQGKTMWAFNKFIDISFLVKHLKKLKSDIVRGDFSTFLFCAATCFGMFPNPGNITFMRGLLTAVALTGGLASLMHSRRARLRLSAIQMRFSPLPASCS